MQAQWQQESNRTSFYSIRTPLRRQTRLRQCGQLFTPCRMPRFVAHSPTTRHSFPYRDFNKRRNYRPVCLLRTWRQSCATRPARWLLCPSRQQWASACGSNAMRGIPTGLSMSPTAGAMARTTTLRSEFPRQGVRLFVRRGPSFSTKAMFPSGPMQPLVSSVAPIGICLCRAGLKYPAKSQVSAGPIHCAHFMNAFGTGCCHGRIAGKCT